MSKLKKQVILDIFNYPIGIKVMGKNIKILKVNKSQADNLVCKYHYSKKPTTNSFLSFLVYYNNKINGVLQLGYGIRPKSKGYFDYKEVREFDRMWLSDEMPKYSETIVISCLHKYLKLVFPEIKYLISYCDTSVGNTGTIYKAANYKLIDKLKADFYILPTGERIHPVSMWHRHKTRRWDFLKEKYKGIKKAEGFQLKLIYKLN